MTVPQTRAATTQSVIGESERAEVVVDEMSGARIKGFCGALALAMDLRGEGPGRQAAYEAFAGSWSNAAAANATFLEFESRC